MRRKWLGTRILLWLSVLPAAAGCGRRGPPQPPIRNLPEAPRLLPLRQEGGEIAIRWFAPRLAEDGSVEGLRLRRAVVLYRLVDIHQLAAAARASRRSSGEPEELAPEEEEAGAETSSPGEEAPVEPEAPPAEDPAPEPPTDPPPSGDEGRETGGDEPETAPADPEPEPFADSDPPADPEAAEAGAAAPAAEAAPEGETAAAKEDDEDREVPDEPEDSGPEPVRLDYEEIEFATLTEVDSETLGEEKVFHLPVEPGWVGQRLEVAVRYESGAGPSEESDSRSLDITGPLPTVERVGIETAQSELTIRWADPRSEVAAATVLSDPIFEVLRRRAGDSETAGRSRGLALADRDFAWGEEVCYRVRLLLAGDDEERVIADPGPESDPAPEPPEEPAAPSPGPGDPGGPAGALAEGVVSPAGWTPAPVTVPAAGAGALSVGPWSSETCIAPTDVFPPPPPSDLRLFWRPERTELSWADSGAEDLAGYHVYRSPAGGSAFGRLTESPVEIPVFADSDRDPQLAYHYAVTAVDGADPPNESRPSEAAVVNPRR